ncbi:MAG TPA: pyridoxal-dependent decarboxylase [Stellaceae bacterium]|nr:pyridoxal-dependent decarboxylase [Stellaceae bacterium]
MPSKPPEAVDDPHRSTPAPAAGEQFQGPELSLDPDDWYSFAASAHAALDDAIEFLRTARQRPVWQPVPQSVRAALNTSIPLQEQSLDEVYHEFKELILPYSTGNTHPRFFGWVHGAGSADGVVAEMLAAAMNANCGGRDHGAIYVERAVVDWCKQLFAMPDSASGLLVSGTSMANLIALAVARNARAEQSRANGLRDHPRQLVAYASSEIHQCVVKAMEILGLGAASLRRIATDGEFRIDLRALGERIAADRERGLEPFCVVGTAGTVNTGAVDDLEGLAALCAAEQLWFHVDGAFGALCVLSDALKAKVKGIERADSLAFDFHKWMHVPYDAGCILVRRGDLHRAAFSMRPPYLGAMPRGLAGAAEWPCDLGPELSRGFRALKVWFAIKRHGMRRFGELIAQNCSQARYLAELISHEPELELLAPVSLNIVCFRYRPPAGGDPALVGGALDLLNEELVQDLHESGVAAPSTTRLRGRLAIRVNITNHRSRRADFDLLVDAILSAGRRRAAPTTRAPGTSASA